MTLNKTALTLGWILLMASAAPAAAPSADNSIQPWLDSQAKIKTWSADFIQTRYLKTLTQPLMATGQVWFAAPNRFRWELGKPAQSIALRTTNHVLLLYPRLKRVEKYALDGTQKGPWRDALSLLEAGFPRSREALEKQFEVSTRKMPGTVTEIELRPRPSSTRAMMPKISLAVDLEKQQLLSTEMSFADGSRMRNEFTNQQMNPAVSEELFSPAIPPDFKLIEPLKKGR